MARYEKQRNFLKSNFDEFKNIKTDKMNGIPKPASIKSYDSNSKIVILPKPSEKTVTNSNIYECIGKRRSSRFY
nr:hypothetical protein [Clostridium chromiireducens]